MKLTPDPDIGYRWYTCGVSRSWSGAMRSWTWKLGPVTVMIYTWDGWQLFLGVLGRWTLWDTGLRQHKTLANQPPIPLTVRARWRRALRWPWILWRYRQAGMPWRVAIRQTLWVICY